MAEVQRRKGSLQGSLRIRHMEIKDTYNSTEVVNEYVNKNSSKNKKLGLCLGSTSNLA